MKISSALLASLLLLAPIAQASEMTPGQWNLSVELDAPGIPEQMRKQVQYDCINPEEAADPEAALRNSWKEDSCSAGEAKRSGNTLRWSADCTMPGTKAKTRVTGKMVLHDSKHYTSEMTMTGNNHSMTTRIDGKWAGSECTE